MAAADMPLNNTACSVYCVCRAMCVGAFPSLVPADEAWPCQHLSGNRRMPLCVLLVSVLNCFLLKYFAYYLGIG